LEKGEKVGGQGRSADMKLEAEKRYQVPVKVGNKGLVTSFKNGVRESGAKKKKSLQREDYAWRKSARRVGKEKVEEDDINPIVNRIATLNMRKRKEKKELRFRCPGPGDEARKRDNQVENAAGSKGKATQKKNL